MRISAAPAGHVSQSGKIAMSFSLKVRYFIHDTVIVASVGLNAGISSSAKAAETMTSNLQVPQKSFADPQTATGCLQ